VYAGRWYAGLGLSQQRETPAQCELSTTDGLGIVHSQKVLCSLEVEISSEHENLHTNPTRNEAQNRIYETPEFYPQHKQVPSVDTM
jgi:hypothetical protein